MYAVKRSRHNKFRYLRQNVCYSWNYDVIFTYTLNWKMTKSPIIPTYEIQILNFIKVLVLEGTDRYLINLA